jgi:hypothetical protein
MMAAERLSMRTIREILRLKWEKKLSTKKIAQSCNIARSTIRDYLERARIAELSWPLQSDLDDGRLEALLFPSVPTAPPEKRGLPAMEYIRKELTRKGVTLRLLWLEYRQANPDGYQYSQFCLLYHQGRLLFLLLPWGRAATPLPGRLSPKIFPLGSMPTSGPLASSAVLLRSSSRTTSNPA